MKGSDEKIVIEDERENLLEFRRGIFPSRDCQLDLNLQSMI